MLRQCVNAGAVSETVCCCRDSVPRQRAEILCCCRVYGSKGGLTWDQESPEKLQFLPATEPAQTLVRNGPGLCESARLACRTPIGHPEGFIEAFANLYTAFHRRLTSSGEQGLVIIDHPTADDGRAGLVFIEACMQSNKEGTWVDINKVGSYAHQ